MGLLPIVLAPLAVAASCGEGAGIGVSLWPMPLRASQGNESTRVASVSVVLNASAAGAAVLEAAARRYGARGPASGGGAGGAGE